MLAIERRNEILEKLQNDRRVVVSELSQICLLYTSDAADEEDSVDLGGRRIIKKKNKNEKKQQNKKKLRKKHTHIERYKIQIQTNNQ